MVSFPGLELGAGLLLAQAIGRWDNFFNQELFVSGLLILLGLGLLIYRHQHPEWATRPGTHPTAQPKRRRPMRS